MNSRRPWSCSASDGAAGSLQWLARLAELGLPIDDALAALPVTGDDDALGRPRVARAMIAMGYVKSVEDAFERYLSHGRPGYVPRDGLGPIEAIRAIRAAGGLASLAHFSEAPVHLGIVRELQDAGLGGLEVYYRSFDDVVVALDGGRRAGARSRRDRWQRLPWRPRTVCGDPCTPVGAPHR